MNYEEIRDLQEAYNQVQELYKGKHGQSEKEYADSRSQGGKMVSGTSKMSGAEYTHGRRVKAANPGMQPDVGGKTKPKSQGKMDRGTRADLEYRKANLKKEELDIFDEVLEFLQVEGYAETLEEAEWMMANLIDEEAIDIILGEGIIDAAKAGSKRHQDAMKGAGRAIKKAGIRTKKLGKALAPAADTAKSAAGGVGKAAKATYDAGKKTGEFVKKGAQRHSDMMRAAKKVLSKEELELFAKIMNDEEAIDIILGEAQAARNNPEKYEREQAKKSAPVRGERTPMPPRGDKRREDFEKWYAKQMGR